MTQTIMIVDDSASVRQMLGRTLKTAGFEVIEAVDGRDALDRLAKRTLALDMLVTDLNMPNLDGVALITAVRAMDRFATMPILMLTTESQVEIKQRGKEAGATGWVIKPFRPEQLIAVIKKLLR